MVYMMKRHHLAREKTALNLSKSLLLGCRGDVSGRTLLKRTDSGAGPEGFDLKIFKNVSALKFSIFKIVIASASHMFA
jgi:hypothetical protein